MKPDPILAEIWRTKDKLAAEANYDVATLFKQLRETERASGRHYVDLSKPAKPITKRKKAVH